MNVEERGDREYNYNPNRIFTPKATLFLQKGLRITLGMTQFLKSPEFLLN